MQRQPSYRKEPPVSKKYRKKPPRGNENRATQLNADVSASETHLQMQLPIAEILAMAREGLEAAIGQVGLLVMHGLIQDEVTQIVGDRHERQEDRSAYRWGRERGFISFAGQKLPIEKPRVRTTEGKEVQLDRYGMFQDDSRLEDAVVERVLRRVSMRDYEGTIDELCDSYGVKKSSVSRRWKAATTKELQALLERDLSDLDVLAIMMDGVHFHDYTLIVALAVTSDGRKHVLGLWQGATENTTLCKALLTDLRDRGLRTDSPTLFVLDGSKALSKAVGEVFGDNAIIQRCQIHKCRNVLSYLPKSCHGIVKQRLRVAWGLRDYSDAKTSLLQVIDYLEGISHSAANSLREGMEETLTLHQLIDVPSLRRIFSTTNSIESLFSRGKDLCRNVRNWKNENMARRWAGAVLLRAEKGFRKIKGFRELPLLRASLRKEVDVQRDVA